jgi:hypothetical protein
MNRTRKMESRRRILFRCYTNRIWAETISRKEPADSLTCYSREAGADWLPWIKTHCTPLHPPPADSFRASLAASISF